jgi:hypothetical protein
MKTTINTKCGIYNTQYSIKDHKNGEVTVRAPFVKWVGDSGHLAFRNNRLAGDDAIAAKEFFKAGELIMAANNGGGALMLDDVLNGNRMDGVSVIGILN